MTQFVDLFIDLLIYRFTVLCAGLMTLILYICTSIFNP